MNIVKYLMPVYLDQRSKNPDELDKINRMKVFIITFAFFFIISGLVAVVNILKEQTLTIQASMQLVMCASLLGTLYLNKYYEKFIHGFQFVLYVALFSFFFWKQMHYQTIRSSITFWLIFTPVVISYIFSNRYAVIGCITGVLITLYVFVTYDYPIYMTMEPLAKETMKVYLMASILSPIMITTFFIMKNNSEKTWRDRLSQNIKEDVHKNHMASLGEISGSIAHEINNPLAIIAMANSKLWRLNKGDSEKEKHHVKIDNTVKRINSITTSLQKISRDDMASGQKDSIGDLIDTIEPLMIEKLKYKGIEFSRDINSDTKIDRKLFGQLFLNLFSNAIEALDGVDKPAFGIKAYEDDLNLYLEVKDNGFGVKEPEKIFEAMYSTKTAGQSNGLGLYLCYKIVDSFAGVIRVQNDGGACFQIVIPLSSL